MGVSKVTYAAGSSAVPFIWSRLRLESDPVVFPLEDFNRVGARMTVFAGSGVPAAVLVGATLGKGEAVAVAVKTGVLLGPAVGVLEAGATVAVLVGTEVNVALGATDVKVLVGGMTVNVLVGEAPGVGVLVGSSLEPTVPVAVGVAATAVAV